MDCIFVPLIAPKWLLQIQITLPLNGPPPHCPFNAYSLLNHATSILSLDTPAWHFICSSWPLHCSFIIPSLSLLCSYIGSFIVPSLSLDCPYIAFHRPFFNYTFLYHLS